MYVPLWRGRRGRKALAKVIFEHHYLPQIYTISAKYIFDFKM